MWSQTYALHCTYKILNVKCKKITFNNQSFWELLFTGTGIHFVNLHVTSTFLQELFSAHEEWQHDHKWGNTSLEFNIHCWALTYILLWLWNDHFLCRMAMIQMTSCKINKWICDKEEPPSSPHSVFKFVKGRHSRLQK